MTQGARAKPRIFDANGREIVPDGERWTVPDGARVVSSISMMDAVQNGAFQMTNDTVTIDDKVMTKDAAIAHLQRRCDGLEGQLVAMDSVRQQSQPMRDELKERANAGAQAAHAAYFAEVRARQGEPTTPQQEYARRLQNAWKGGTAA